MVFFQAALLAGYAYALIASRWTLRQQRDGYRWRCVHVVFIGAASPHPGLTRAHRNHPVALTRQPSKLSPPSSRHFTVPGRRLQHRTLHQTQPRFLDIKEPFLAGATRSKLQLLSAVTAVIHRRRAAAPPPGPDDRRRRARGGGVDAIVAAARPRRGGSRSALSPPWRRTCFSAGAAHSLADAGMGRMPASSRASHAPFCAGAGRSRCSACCSASRSARSWTFGSGSGCLTRTPGRHS